MIFLLKFLLDYYCDTEQRGPNRVLFINSGHFTGYFLRESAGIPHRFLEAKPEGSGNFFGSPKTHIFVQPVGMCESKKMYRLSMWLGHERYVSCLWTSSPWMRKFGQFLVDFGLEREYLAIFSKRKVARI